MTASQQFLLILPDVEIESDYPESSSFGGYWLEVHTPQIRYNQDFSIPLIASGTGWILEHHFPILPDNNGFTTSSVVFNNPIYSTLHGSNSFFGKGIFFMLHGSILKQEVFWYVGLQLSGAYNRSCHFTEKSKPVRVLPFFYMGTASNSMNVTTRLNRPAARQNRDIRTRLPVRFTRRQPQ
ncbi:MAG: hypothetical protein WA151_15610 [Desulfatirhabdiaceae bacterium]